MATSFVLLTLGTGTTSVDFIVRGNLQAYQNVAEVASSGFTAAEADFTKTAGVVTPIPALLESGSFRRLKAKSKDGKKSRDLVIPTAGQTAISAAIHAADGLTIDGVVCTSASEGLRRVPR
ncbi:MULTISPECIES: hypothetical protein [Pseudanabaena]|uniref:Uncharacterized protein n=2 Tax=Pseudanabaena TaxID=1152 RepID=L8MZ78_9CYAN|nr:MULTISPECIES: hypothetical protein [Pseudanabaena]ELS32791.1 hypothetical protein Pse7429DRAFT_1996 [Pseudanabaena biceps PCC 7429]MDG3494977.1 hypothetical protein [Pseudanabaena catenata USMAC16]